uniref:Cell wall-active antibiotics response LiaF-like C-terminal domain-containing protein n=1 Tax=candidate division WOR-3 bacterium TaxID=2052148 RepID=A0A7C3N949_UNCW3
MKNDKDFAKLILGIILIFIGGMIFLSTFFNISIPIFKTIISFLLIYLGAMILLGKKTFFIVNEKFDGRKKDHLVLFSSTHIDASEVEEYKTLNIDVIFGEGKVYIKKGMNCKIYSTSILGQITTPDGENITFGSKDMKIGENPDKGVTIIATVILGTLEIVEK